MRKYIAKGKKKNKDEWVEGDYLYNDKTKNHLIATEKMIEKKRKILIMDPLILSGL